MHTSAFVKAVDMDQEVIDQMHLAIENQNMFAIEIEERPHCITLDIKVVEGYVSGFPLFLLYHRQYDKTLLRRKTRKRVKK